MMAEVEIWRPVQADPRYQVSTRGRVRGVRGHILSTFDNGRGYRIVCLPSRKYRVHRLVAEAFLGPAPDPDAQVNHKDFDKANNAVANLEWVSPGENMFHFLNANPDFAVGTGKPPPNRRFTDEIAAKIRARCSVGETRRALASEYGVAKSTIDAIASGSLYAASATHSAEITA